MEEEIIVKLPSTVLESEWTLILLIRKAFDFLICIFRTVVETIYKDILFVLRLIVFQKLDDISHFYNVNCTLLAPKQCAARLQPHRCMSVAMPPSKQ